MQSDAYTCALCAAGYEPTLDEMVEVTFTVSPRVRRIAAHDPHSLPPAEYFRQIYWGSGIEFPEENYEALVDEFIVEALELPPGEKAVISLQLPEAFVIVFEPVTHAAQFIDVKGEPTKRAPEPWPWCSTAVTAITTRWRCSPGPLRLVGREPHRRAHLAFGLPRQRRACTACSAGAGRS